MASFTGTTFAAAETFLVKARNGNSRRLASNRHLARVDQDTIALVLHSTAVVTYHRDGTSTIYGGGWNTVTTKRTIRDYSPVSVYSVDGEWVVGHKTELTPPRVQKCRSCKGRGTWQEMDHCSGPAWWDESVCNGGTIVYGVPMGHDGWWESRSNVPCEHGQQERHTTQPCGHGETGRHALGMSDRSCYRCDGTGRADYGSNRIPITVSSSQAYTIDASGVFLGLTARPHAPGHHGKVQPEPATPHTMGGEIVGQLATVLPNVTATVRHPVNGTEYALNSVIVSLNDGHGWSRERIADWLDTLDVDLRFTA